MPLAIAAKEGHWRAVEEILDHNLTILPRDAGCLNTQLNKALAQGDLQSLSIISKCCINVDTTNNTGSTALLVAAEVGHKEICQILLKSRASVNSVDKYGKAPLILDPGKGGIEIIQELLTAIAVKDLLIPLFLAATEGHTNVA